MDWPASHIALVAGFINNEPAPEERVEFTVAQLCALTSNMNRGKGTAPRKVADFLLFRQPWKEPDLDLSSDRYTEADREMLRAIDNL